MKHKQGMRVLSFLLSVLLLISVTSVLASARWDYAKPYDTQKGKAVMSSGQCASMLLDFLDNMLSTSVGEILPRTQIGVTGMGETVLWIDLSSVDRMAQSLSETFGSAAKGLADTLLKMLYVQYGDQWGLGDLRNLDVSALTEIANSVRRDGGTASSNTNNPKQFSYPGTPGSTEGKEGTRDIYVLQHLFKFLADNTGLLSKLVGSNNKGTSYNGQFYFGHLPAVLKGEGVVGLIVKGLVDISTLEPFVAYMEQMSVNFTGFLKSLLVPMLAGLVPDADPALLDPANASNVVLDALLEDMLNGLLGPLLGGLLPGLELNLDIYDPQGNLDNTYDMLRNTINGALNGGVVDMLVNLIAPMLLIRVDEEHPEGVFDETMGDPLIGSILWAPLVVGGEGLGGLLTDGALIPHSIPDPGATPAESAAPMLMLQEAFDWLLMRGVGGTGFLDRFMLRNYPDAPGYNSALPKGLIIKDAPNGSRYSDALQHFLGTLLGNLGGILEMLGLGIELDTEALETMDLSSQLGSILKGLIAMIPGAEHLYIPDEAMSLREVATYLLVDLCADMIPDKKYDLISRNAKAPENVGKSNPPAADLPSTGKALNPSTDGVLVVLGDLLRYMINPAVANLNLPENKTFDGLISALVGWLLGSYGGVLRTPSESQLSNGWATLSYFLFGNTEAGHTNDGVFRQNWLSKDIVTAGNAPGNSILRETVVNRLLSSILDLDFKKLFTLLQANQGGELDTLPPVQLILHVVARLLNSVFKIPSGDSLNGMNATGSSVGPANTLIPFDLTTLDGLLQPRVLGPLVRKLLTQLGKPEVTSELLGAALPLLSSLIGLWSQDDYAPHIVRDAEMGNWYDSANGNALVLGTKSYLRPNGVQDAMPFPFPQASDHPVLASAIAAKKEQIENKKNSMSGSEADLQALAALEAALAALEAELRVAMRPALHVALQNAVPVIKAKLEQVQPLHQNEDAWNVLPVLNASGNIVQEGYRHYGAENYNSTYQYRYNFYNAARTVALEQINTIEAYFNALNDPEAPEFAGELPTEYDLNNAYATLSFYTDNSWNGGNMYKPEIIVDSARSDEQTSNGGLEFQHLLATYERIAGKGYAEQNYTRASWAVYKKAYDFAYNLMDRFYGMKIKGITQAAITRARRELVLAERQLATFSKLADFTQFDVDMRNWKNAERDSIYYYNGNSDLPETIGALGTIDYFLDVLAEAYVMSTERASYDSTMQAVVDEMDERVNEAYNALQKLVNVLYPDSESRVYMGLEEGAIPMDYQDATATMSLTPFSIRKILYNLPYGLTEATSGYKLEAYVHPFVKIETTDTFEWSWTEKNDTKPIMGQTYLGTGHTVKIRKKKTGGMRPVPGYTVDALMLLIFGDLSGSAYVTTRPASSVFSATDYPANKVQARGDGWVTAVDVQLFDQAKAEKIVLTNAQLLAADVNHDGRLTNADRDLLYAASINVKKNPIEQKNFNWAESVPTFE
ncbi:MAG: hypothetical protein LBC83_04020 [Oscillospiraceae bacterium]|jgi:hypothetical protein|nr:hypothetical protein [Oscillospiraceae bacterium]